MAISAGPAIVSAHIASLRQFYAPQLRIGGPRVLGNAGRDGPRVETSPVNPGQDIRFVIKFTHPVIVCDHDLGK